MKRVEDINTFGTTNPMKSLKGVSILKWNTIRGCSFIPALLSSRNNQMIIYKTTNLINDKIYIGKHNKDSDSYLGSGKILKQAINKYGRENFKRETLECVSEDNWREREKFWIKELKSQDVNIGYNITDGGCGGDTWTDHPNYKEMYEKRHGTEGKQRFSKSIREARENNPQILERASKRMIGNVLGKLNKGRKMSDEQKQLVSKNVKNSWKNLSDEKKIKHSKRMSELHKGKPKSKKQIENMKISARTPERQKSLSENAKGIKNNNFKWTYFLEKNDIKINTIGTTLKQFCNDNKYLNFKWEGIESSYHKNRKYKGWNIERRIING